MLSKLISVLKDPNNNIEGWILPWTSRKGFDGFDGFHICAWETKGYFIEDHCLITFKTIGQLRLVFMMMGQDLDAFKV